MSSRIGQQCWVSNHCLPNVILWPLFTMFLMLCCAVLSIGQNLDSAMLVAWGLYKTLFADPLSLCFIDIPSFNTRFYLICHASLAVAEMAKMSLRPAQFANNCGVACCDVACVAVKDSYPCQAVPNRYCSFSA